MAVRESWCLALTWRTSSVSTNDETCVQVALCETPPESREERALCPEPPPDHA